MKDVANAVDQWFKENPRLGSVVTAIPTALGILYIGEFVAALLGDRSPNWSPWQGGLLETQEGWIGLAVGAVIIIVVHVQVRRLFRRYVDRN